MNELVSLIGKMLNAGTLRIEINISFEDGRVSKTTQGYLIKCPYCSWKGEYASERSAKAALNGHMAQCPNYYSGLNLDWLKSSSEQTSE